MWTWIERLRPTGQNTTHIERADRYDSMAKLGEFVGGHRKSAPTSNTTY